MFKARIDLVKYTLGVEAIAGFLGKVYGLDLTDWIQSLMVFILRFDNLTRKKFHVDWAIA